MTRTLKNNGQWVVDSASGGNEDELDVQNGRIRSGRAYLSFFTSCGIALSRKKKLWLIVGQIRGWRGNEMLYEGILPSLPRDLRVEHDNMCVVHVQNQSLSLEATRSHARAHFPLSIGQRWPGRDPRWRRRRLEGRPLLFHGESRATPARTVWNHRSVVTGILNDSIQNYQYERPSMSEPRREVMSRRRVWSLGCPLVLR